MTVIVQDDSKDSVQAQLESSKPFLKNQLRENEFVRPDQVTIVIPTLNEEEGIANVIEDLKSQRFRNILVVDGYSTDRTVEIAKSMGAYVLEQVGTGKAGAIRTAVEQVETPYLLVMDGDCTYKASDIYRLMAHARDYDEVIGARTQGRKNIPFVNRLGNWIISKVFKLLFDKPVTDVLSGMYLVKTEKLRESKLTSDSFDIEVEVATSIAIDGDIAEVPISYEKRVGKQKLRKMHAFRILSTMFWMANSYNPVLLYGALASVSILPAIGVLSWVVEQKIFLNVWHSGYMLLGVMFFLFATQAIAFSTISLMMKRSEHRVMLQLRKNLSPIN